MDYEIVELPARTVVGPTVRASNNSSGEGAVIGQLWARFLGEGLDRSIPGTRVEPYVHVLLGKHADTGNVVRNQTAHAGDSAVLTSMYSAMRRS